MDNKLLNNKINRKLFRIYIFILIILVSILTSCVSEIEDLSEEEKLYYYKSQNTNIDNKLNKVIERIELKDKYKLEEVEIKSSEKPFEINIVIDLKYGKVAQREDFFVDSALLFSLFDDLDFISYSIVDDLDEYFIFSREEIDDEMLKIFGQSTTELGSNLNNFTKLFKYSEIVKNNNSDILIDSHIGDFIEENINSLDSKNFHDKDEYREILQEEGSLDYILEQFIKKNVKNDNRGHILKCAAIDLLGPINNVDNWENLDPLEWYNELEILMPIKISNDIIEYDNEYKNLVYKAHYDNKEKKGFIKEDSFTLIGIDIKGIYEDNNVINIYAVTRCLDMLLFENGNFINLTDNLTENIVVYEKINGKYNFKEIIDSNLEGSYNRLLNEFLINSNNTEDEFMKISHDKLNEDIKNNLENIMRKNNIKIYNLDNII